MKDHTNMLYIKIFWWDLHTSEPSKKFLTPQIVDYRVSEISAMVPGTQKSGIA